MFNVIDEISKKNKLPASSYYLLLSFFQFPPSPCTPITHF